MTRFEELTSQFDHLPAAEAVARAWRALDPRRFGTWHATAREEVTYLMPLLARALDRLLIELDDVMPSTDWSLWADVAQSVQVDRIRRPALRPRR